MSEMISEQEELFLVELEKEDKLPKLDPKSYHELSQMCDEILSLINERKKAKKCG